MQGEYPEVEVLWMLTKTWNCGVRFFRWTARRECMWEEGRV